MRKTNVTKALLKKMVIAFGFLSLFFSAVAQQAIDYNARLPENKKIKKGVLPNGLTYYIYSTDVNKDRASYYIIQNVGSILENDKQQGLAHFLEHMAFNGTKNFEGKGILNTFENHGLVFGKDINAYTSFDETVYNINNVPVTDELIDISLLVLHDWSDYLLLTDKEIDAERGVIKEEWRTSQNGGMRIMQKSMPVLFNNSKYSKRLPIGLMDIVENFDYKALRDFYHDWYRTDLQAIAVIGDIDVNDIERRIKKLFSTIPVVKNPKERFVVDIPGNDDMLYNLATDKEVSTANISFFIRHHKSLKDETVADLKRDLLNSMAISMLSERLGEISQKPEAPFLGVRIGYGGMTRTCNSFDVTIFPKSDMQQQAFKRALMEINRAVKFGFIQSEIDRTIDRFKNSYRTQIDKIKDLPHGAIAGTIKANYLNNKVMSDIKKEYELAKQIFDNLTAEEVHNAIKNLYTKKNRVVNVTGVKDKNNLSKEQAQQIIDEVENDTSLEAYKEDFKGKTLVSGITINKGTILSEKENKAVGATTFVLSNGIIVHYKFVDKNDKDVQLQALSYGGMSLIDDENYPSASLMSNLVYMSGLGNYSATDLKKVLAGKTASTATLLAGVTESIKGYTVTKDVKILMQMLYLRFVKPRFDKKSFKVLQENIDQYLIRRSKDIGEKMRDSVTLTLYGKDSPRKRIFDKAFANDITFDEIKTIYLDRFGDASDFEFFIVGDVQKDILKPLLEKYIASIPTRKTKENWKDKTVPWAKNTIDKDIYLEMENPKSGVRIAFKKKMKYTLKNALLARTLGAILQLRYTETLREEEGGTYGARAVGSMYKRPVEQAFLSINFDCGPGKEEELLKIVYQEIDKIKNGTIKQEDLNKTLTNYLKERKEAKDHNAYYMSLLINYFREGYNMNDPKNFEDIVKSITVKDVQNFAKSLFTGSDSYEIVFKPKK